MGDSSSREFELDFAKFICSICGTGWGCTSCIKQTSLTIPFGNKHDWLLGDVWLLDSYRTGSSCLHFLPTKLTKRHAKTILPVQQYNIYRHIRTHTHIHIPYRYLHISTVLDISCIDICDLVPLVPTWPKNFRTAPRSRCWSWMRRMRCWTVASKSRWESWGVGWVVRGWEGKRLDQHLFRPTLHSTFVMVTKMKNHFAVHWHVMSGTDIERIWWVLFWFNGLINQEQLTRHLYIYWEKETSFRVFCPP